MKGASAEGIWVVDAKNGNGSVKFGGPGRQPKKNSVFLSFSSCDCFRGKKKSNKVLILGPFLYCHHQYPLSE